MSKSKSISVFLWDAPREEEEDSGVCVAEDADLMSGLARHD